MSRIIFTVKSLPFKEPLPTNTKFSNQLADYVYNYLAEHGIDAGLQRLGSNSFMITARSSTSGAFLSARNNKFPLKKGDPRIAKSGRDYLNTKRLTKKQWTKIKEVCTTLWDDYQIDADVVIEMKDGQKSIVRTGFQNSELPKPKTFAEEHK